MVDSQKELNVRGWIEDLCKRGRVSFTMEEAERHFWYMTTKAIRSSIYRLVAKGRVYSAWHGFYVIVPDKYALKGFVPPIEYIDALMVYTGHKYYVGLLSAAAIYGAFEPRQPMDVIASSNDIRSLGNRQIGFFAKSAIPSSYLRQHRTEYGTALVSSPELTALDLIFFEHRVGGLKVVGEAVSNLSLDFSTVGDDLIRTFRAPVIQRLGYLLERAAGDEYDSAWLYARAKAAGLKFRRIPLDRSGQEVKGDSSYVKNRWKIIDNLAN